MHIVHRCFWNCFFIKEIKKKNMLTDCSITCICRVPGRFKPWGGVFSSRSNKIMIQIFKKKKLSSVFMHEVVINILFVFKIHTFHAVHLQHNYKAIFIYDKPLEINSNHFCFLFCKFIIGQIVDTGHFIQNILNFPYITFFVKKKM